MRVSVAGAGVLGLTSALALADAGCEVTVWDPAAMGANASGVAAGMLSPVFEAVLDDQAAHFDLLLAARNLWPGLEARAGIRLDRAGAMAAGSTDWLQAVAEGIARLGIRPTELPAAMAADLAPGLAQARGALLVREDWRLDAGAALVALRKAARGAGVMFRRAAAHGFEGADRLVIATGAGQGLAELAPELGGLMPIKGHILTLEGLPSPAVVVRGEGAYAAPAPGGLRLGATMEAGVSDPAVEPAKAAALRTAGAALFPAVAGAAARLAAGVRAATPDGLPMVGRAADSRVVLAVGARRNGWLLAPLAARIVVASVLDRDAGEHAARLDPARFARQ